MANMKDFTNKKVEAIMADKFDLSERTLRNYKRLEDGNIPSKGKYHLYKAMFQYLYLNEYDLLKNEDDEIKQRKCNRIETLLKNIESIDHSIDLLTVKEVDSEVKEAINKSIKKSVNNIKEILGGLL